MELLVEIRQLIGYVKLYMAQKQEVPPHITARLEGLMRRAVKDMEEDPVWFTHG